VIANYGRENLSPSSEEEQMKRKQYVWKMKESFMAQDIM
jgi:hypothetical protein